MNTTSESIPTTLSPETAFHLSLAPAPNQTAPAWDGSRTGRFDLPPERDFLRGGIPESALHD